MKPGQNTIERKSTESSVTIPFERTFRNLEESRPIGGDSLDQFNFCGCGWPQHMLIPKGKEEGFPMDLFIMISDYTGDAVSTFYTYWALTRGGGGGGCLRAYGVSGDGNLPTFSFRPFSYPSSFLTSFRKDAFALLRFYRQKEKKGGKEKKKVKRYPTNAR